MRGLREDSVSPETTGAGEAAKLRALGENRRRVFERARAEKQGRDRDRLQHRNGRKQRRRFRASGCERRIAGFDPGLDDRDRALMLRMRGIGVQMLVQRRSGAEDKREQKRAQRRESDGSAAVHDADVASVIHEVQGGTRELQTGGDTSKRLLLPVVPTAVEESRTARSLSA